jgi:hypothetical protein
MTGQFYAVPGLGGTTSTEVVLEQVSTGGCFMLAGATTSGNSAAAVLAAAQRALDGGSRDRLAALREAAALRMRTMPTYEDTAEEIADRMAEAEALDQLQARSTAWEAED